MGLDLWFPPDVARILAAAYEAMRATAAAGGGGEAVAGYRQGYGAALRAVAAGFGVPDPADGEGERSGGWLRAGEGVERPAASPWSGTPAGGRAWGGRVVDGQVGPSGRR